MRSYEGFTKAILCGTGAAFLVLAVLMILDVGTIPIVAYAIAFLAALFVAKHRGDALFPQWRGLRWRIPGVKILFLLGVFIGLLLAENLLGTDSPLLIIGVFFAGMMAPWQNYRQAKAYHLDELSSIEELIQMHPDAEEEIVVK